MAREKEPGCSVVHIISSLDIGGTEMMLYKLLSHLNRSRFSTLVVSMTDKGTLGSRIEALGVPVHTLGMRPGLPNPVGLWRLLCVLKKERPNILQTWLYHADLLGLVVGKMAQVPAIAWNLRCSYWDRRQYRALSTMVVCALAQLSSLPDAVVINSKAGRRFHKEMGYAPRRWVLIPNGFDLKEFQPDSEARIRFRQRLGLPSDVLLIGCVARFDPMKDHSTFLHACKLFLKTCRDAHFILVGRGINESNCVLAQTIDTLGIEKYVHLLGERSDIPSVLAALDIAVSSSTGEGFSNVIGEAMSCGVPCVVTDVGDSAWIVGETGKVVPPKDSMAMAKAWSELIALGKEGRRQLGLAARRRIEEHFGLETIVRRYENLYEELFSGFTTEAER